MILVALNPFSIFEKGCITKHVTEPSMSVNTFMGHLSSLNRIVELKKFSKNLPQNVSTVLMNFHAPIPTTFLSSSPSPIGTGSYLNVLFWLIRLWRTRQISAQINTFGFLTSFWIHSARKGIPSSLFGMKTV